MARLGLWALLVALLAACADTPNPPLAALADSRGNHTRIWFDNDSAELDEISQRYLMLNGLGEESILVDERGHAERLAPVGGEPNQRVEVSILGFAQRPPC